MIKSIRKLLSANEARPPAAIPAGQRVYAIGDVHGRRDLLETLIAAIDEDDAARGPAGTSVVLLGDLVDRGPDSAGVLDLVRNWPLKSKLHVLCGNHEEMFLRSLRDVEVLPRFLAYGGRETLLSYPIDALALEAGDAEAVQAMMVAAVPQEDIDFLQSLELHVVIGDYLFVHAGIKPGQPIEEQTRSTLRWIREPFLSYGGWHDHVVIHGHTIVAEPEILHNRIGIDTGAYMSGRLTALGLEGEERWLIETHEQASGISVITQPA